MCISGHESRSSILPVGKYMESKTKEILWVDWIRALATFGVVFLHAASPLLYRYNKIPEFYWWIGNIFDSMVRMCVPLFFMISGFLLLQKEYSLLTFFSKRVNKVLIPLLAWSIFFLLWKAYYQHSMTLSLSSFFNLITVPAYFHLWFLYALIGLYLITPVLRIIVQYGDEYISQYFVVLWFIGASLFPLIEKFTDIKIGINLGFIEGYTGFLILGWILGNKEITKKTAVIAGLMTFICIFITAVGTYYLTVNNQGKYSDYFYAPLAPNVIFLAISVFLLIRYFVENFSITHNEPVIWIIRSISSSSLGIFLVHICFLYILREGHLGVYLYGYRGNPILFIPITAVIAFLLSYGTISILRMNHLTRKLVP